MLRVIFWNNFFDSFAYNNRHSLDMSVFEEFCEIATHAKPTFEDLKIHSENEENDISSNKMSDQKKLDDDINDDSCSQLSYHPPKDQINFSFPHLPSQKNKRH